MMKCYVLTEQNTRGTGAADRHFTLGNWMTRAISKPGEDNGPEWFLVYDHPLLAMLFPPRGIWDYQPARLFESLFDGRAGHHDDGGMMRFVHQLKLDKELPLPVITDNQRRRFAIYCAREAVASYDDSKWFDWTDGWTSGVGRGPIPTAAGCSIARVLNYATAAAKECAHSVSAERRSTSGGDPSVPAIAFACRAATHAVRALSVNGPLPSSKWVALAERAIADENKLEESR